MKTKSCLSASLDAGSTKVGEGVVVRRMDLTGSPTEGETGLAYAAVSEAEAAGLALSPGQRKAIEKLTSGSTAVEAATAAGVGRSTLYRWLKDDPEFIAAYNAWQRDVLATARGKLLALTDLAVSAVGKPMSRGDGRLALQLLERMGVAERPSEGETDSQEVKRKQEQAAEVAALERRQEAVELARKTRGVQFDESLEEDGFGWKKSKGAVGRRG